MIPKILAVGHSCLDIVHSLPEIPAPNIKVPSAKVDVQVGGNAANEAVALCDLGAHADLHTILGRDSHPFTRILLALLKSRGVGTKLCLFDETQDCPSSTIMVLPDGERAIMNWQSNEIRSAIPSPIALDGYAMIVADTYRLPMVRSVFCSAAGAGIPTMIDVDDPLPDIGMIPAAGYVWFSHEAWRRHRIPIKDLQARFGGVVGITDGHRPVTWVGNDGVVRYHQPPAVNAINTLGAGDVFRARFALGVCMKESIERSIEQACIAACEHITGMQLTRAIA